MRVIPTFKYFGSIELIFKTVIVVTLKLFMVHFVSSRFYKISEKMLL